MVYGPCLEAKEFQFHFRGFAEQEIQPERQFSRSRALASST
jgi:hypothetical protein